jgi:hypothetical protein
MSKKTKYNPITAESRQRKIMETIKDDWYRIREFNICDRDGIRPFDILALYQEIKDLEKELFTIKLLRQFWNAGSKDFVEFKKTSIHEDIFKLQQYKERLQKLTSLSQTKMDSMLTVIIDNKFIADEKKELLKLIDVSDKNLTEFNKKLEISIEI